MILISTVIYIPGSAGHQLLKIATVYYRIHWNKKYWSQKVSSVVSHQAVAPKTDKLFKSPNLRAMAISRSTHTYIQYTKYIFHDILCFFLIGWKWYLFFIVVEYMACTGEVWVGVFWGTVRGWEDGDEGDNIRVAGTGTGLIAVEEGNVVIVFLQNNIHHK